ISETINVTANIDNLAFELIKRLKSQQDKNRKGNADEKNFLKRRVICGAHETLKFAQSGRVKLIFYAKNMDENNLRAASNFHSLQIVCPLAGIPMIEVLTRKELSRIMNKFPYVAVVGVIDFSGFERETEDIVKNWKIHDSCKLFHIDQSSLLP
ncbi:Ribosomal protein eL8/eL30/eS12/Gadd45 domain-containing protein, partial [Caenorhabditis elegans]